MGYQIKNGNLYQHAIHVYGQSYWIYVGPAPKLTVMDKPLSIMSRYERTGRTASRNYKYTQRVANCLLVGLMSCSSFLRD